MNSQPLVSVIVPVYNSAVFLEECVRSITNQTYTNIEIILVNDGSKDNSLEICFELQKKDGRIKIIDQQNGGPSVARNTGIDAATGEFIGFVDSDDTIDPQMYEVLVKDIMETNSQMSAIGMQFCYSNGNTKLYCTTGEKRVIEGKDIYSVFFENQMITFGPVDKLYRRDAIGDIRFDISIRMCEDEKFIYQVLKNVKRVSYNPRVLYNINYTDNSLSRATPTRYHLAMIDVNEYIMSEITDEDVLDKLRIYNASLCLSYFVVHYDNGHFTDEDKKRINSILNSSKDLILAKGNRLLKIKMRLFLISPKLLRFVLNIKNKSN